MPLEPGLPHGRLWVAEAGCDCPLCAEALRQHHVRTQLDQRTQPEPEPGPFADREEPRTHLRWIRTKKQLHGAVSGPPRDVYPGAHVLAYDPALGRHRHVTIANVGRVFLDKHGNKARYGYPR